MKNYVQPGKTLVVAAPSGGVASGDPVLAGALFGIAACAADEGADVEITTEGVFDLPKTTGQTWSVGDPLYWDASGKKLTKTAGDNVRVATATKAAGSNDTRGHGRIGAAGVALVGLSAPQSAILDLGGTLTGTIDGDLADVAHVSTGGGNTYSDAAINTVIDEVNLQLKEIQAKVNSGLGALRGANIITD